MRAGLVPLPIVGIRWWPRIWRPGQIRLGVSLAGQRRAEGPVRGGWRLPAGVPVAAFVFTARFYSDPVSCKIGVTRHPMKIAPTTVMADDGGVCDVVPFSRHRCGKSRHHARDAPRETLDLGLSGSDDGDIFDVVLPSGGIVLEQVLTGRAQRRSGVSSPASRTADLGSMLQWSLGVRCGWTD